jgi:hypothetical protein
MEKELVMKLKSVLLVPLLSIGILTVSAHSAFARGYFSRGNPSGVPAATGYPLAHTSANQAWETNNAWANFNAQNRQVPNVSPGNPGSAPQHNAVTP